MTGENKISLWTHNKKKKQPNNMQKHLSCAEEVLIWSLMQLLLLLLSVIMTDE